MEHKPKPKKESEGKISYMEIPPHFIAAMAKRMNENTKYPLFNYKLQMDNEGLLQLVDATERHLADLKCLLQNEPPVHNLTETPLDHLPAIANNAAMIFYQLSKYDFGSEEKEITWEEKLDVIYTKDFIIHIFSTDNETNKSEREFFVKQCQGELYEYIKSLFGDDFQISCTDINVRVSLKIGNHEAHTEYSMLDYKEEFYYFLPIDEKTTKEDKELVLKDFYVQLLINNIKNQLEDEILKKLVYEKQFPDFKNKICKLFGENIKIIQLRNDLYRIDFYYNYNQVIIEFNSEGNQILYEKEGTSIEIFRFFSEEYLNKISSGGEETKVERQHFANEFTCNWTLQKFMKCVFKENFNKFAKNLLKMVKEDKELLISRFNNKDYITKIFLGGEETKSERKAFVKELTCNETLQNSIVGSFKGSFIPTFENDKIIIKILFESYSIESVYVIKNNYEEISYNRIFHIA